MLTITNEGILEPLDLKVTGNSQYELLAPTRDITDQTFADGEIDQGTELDTGEFVLHCVSSEGLTKVEKNELKAVLAGQLNSLREYTLLNWESDPDKALYVRLSGRPEFTEYSGHLEISLTFIYQPIWVSVEEQSLVGSGTATNEGTFEAPFIVEIEGPATNPGITVGSEIMAYTGTLAVGDLLVIDTSNMTVKFNGVNALANYNGIFPKLQPGETSVTAGSNVTIKWHDCWI